MNLFTLLAAIKEQGAKLQLRDGQLYLKGSLPDDLRSVVRQYKTSLIELLQQQSVSPPSLKRRPKQRKMSLAQQRLCFMEQMSGGEIAYIEPFYSYHIQGQLDSEVLGRAIHEIITRHEVLHTCYQLTDEHTNLHLQSVDTPPLKLTDLRSLCKGEQQRQLAVLKQQESLTPFDLENAPLLRGNLVQLADDQHLLLLTAHHIAIDGWSLAIIVKEISQFYAAFAKGRPSPLPMPDFQFSDVAHWQQELLDSPASATALQYWQQQLSGVPEQCTFPTDFPRPRVQDFHGATLETVVDAVALDKLRALCRDRQCTLFSGIQALLAILLSRYRNETDIVIGSPESGRSITQLQSLVGFFVNNQVLRTDLSSNPNFVELLAQAKATQKQAVKNANVPFEALAEQAGVSRSRAYNPLFQVMLVLLNVERPVLELPGMHVTTQHPHRAQSKFDLTLYAVEIEGELHLQWEYATALYEASTIKRIARHFGNLLAAVLAEPTKPIEELPFIDDEERVELAMLGCPDKRALPAKSLIELFRQQARQTPHSKALLTHTGASMSYQQLDAASARLARLMQMKGIAANDRVGVAFQRSVEMVTAILATLKLGACYVPMDPTYPKKRLAHIANDSSLSLVLTDVESEPNLPDGDYQKLALDDSAVKAELIQLQERELAPTLISDDPLYLLYTSGSTGVPKGVLGSERGTLNRLDWMWRTYPFLESETCCLKTSLNFVDHVWEMFGPLLKGIPLLILPQQEVQDIELFVGHLARYSVSRLVLVPSLLHEILALDKTQRQMLAGLSLWTASGEALTAELVKAFYHTWPDATLLNIYGSTEVSADVTCLDTRTLHEVQDFLKVRAGSSVSSPALPERVSIGQPLTNVHIHILDKHQQPAPLGMTGELYISGDCLAQGYTDPELTEKVFIESPLVAGERLFRTGDLGRWLVDGNIELQGRADQQIQLRGFRIEPREIEQVISSSEGVGGAKVLLHTDDTGEKRLLAYVVSTAGESIVSPLKQILAKQLPDYMQPSSMIVLETFPLLPNGKLDIQHLPAPSFGSIAPKSLPLTATEQDLAVIWQKILGMEGELCTDTSFFELGGHSLLATRVINRVRAQWGVTVHIKHFLEAPTIKAVAMLIDFQLAQRQMEEPSEGRIEVTL